MVQILLMLEVLFTQDSKVENLFCGASPALNPACSSAIISSVWGLSLFKMTFSMTVLELLMRLIVLAELQVALLKECNNQRLIPWGRPFSCSPDLC